MPSKGSRTYKYVGDPKTGKSVSEARVRLEEKLGRKLRPGETVEHKDRDETNNDPKNLKVLPAAKNSSEGGKRGAAITNAKRGRHNKTPKTS